MTYTKLIYLSSPLFTLAEFRCNKDLADAIYSLSNGNYLCKLPQDLNILPYSSQEEIKDACLTLLFNCDGFIGNLDGVEVDSGVTSEYVVAKFLDLPSVLYRTDFRAGGDTLLGFSVNSMLVGYPRTKILTLPHTNLSILADSCVYYLDHVFNTKPVLSSCEKELFKSKLKELLYVM